MSHILFILISVPLLVLIYVKLRARCKIQQEKERMKLDLLKIIDKQLKGNSKIRRRNTQVGIQAQEVGMGLGYPDFNPMPKPHPTHVEIGN